MSSWPPRRPDREAASAAAEFPGAGCRSLRGTKGQASSLPPATTAPGAKPLTVYGWHGKGHLPALLRRSLEHAQYTSVHFAETLMLTGLAGSVGSVGDAYDNALAETTIGLYKTECTRAGSPFRTGPIRTLADLEEVTSAWVHWYNTARLMHRLGRRPPAEAEAEYYQQAKNAA